MWLLNTAFVPFVEILNKKFAQTAVLLPPERHILSYLFNYFPVPRVGRESNKKKSKKFNCRTYALELLPPPPPHLRPNIDTCITQTVLSTFEVATCILTDPSLGSSTAFLSLSCWKFLGQLSG